MEDTGKLILSVDFELLWGVRDKRTRETYGENIMGVQEALPRMVEAFEKYKVKGTFATVGFLFATTKEELVKYCPSKKPAYSDQNLSPYNGHFDLIGDNEELDKYHFASSLINLLQGHPDQEIATHTFSHFYCLEEGQTIDDFKQDILAAVAIAESRGVELKSLVFPRNQFNYQYLKVLMELGITSYRGNERVWFQQIANGKAERLLKRAFILLDTYLNVSGHNCYDMAEIVKHEPFDIPSSRFLRPYSHSLKMIEGLKLRRIKKGMTYAARNKKVYHLWWHPHNFGVRQEEHFQMLYKILDHYAVLNSTYGFESMSMRGLSDLLKQQQ